MSSRRLMLVGAFAIAVAAVASGRAQAPPRDAARVSVTGSAVVTGAVFSGSATREPARHVTVTLSGGPDDRRVIGTDDRGQFLFVGLPAGSYTLSVSKAGWLSANYGAPKLGLAGTPISLADGQRFTTEPILLVRGATIAGRLVDSRNQPMSGAVVEAMQFTIANGEWSRRALQGTSSNTSTNAHGEFRLFGLPPGEYVVATSILQVASALEVRETSADETRWAEQMLAGRGGESAPPPRGKTLSPSPTYFPGVQDVRGAGVIHLEAGEERTGVDFAFRYVATARVSGIVTGLDGAPAAGAAVTRVRRSTNEISTLGGSVATTDRTDAAGKFSLAGVAPGSYWITAKALQPGPPVRTLWGTTETAVVGQDVPDLAITLQPGMTVTGKSVFEGRTTIPGNVSVQLRLIPAPGAGAVASSTLTGSRPDGGFQFTSVLPGTYRFLALSANTPNPTWVARSAMLDGKDLLDTPVDVRPGIDLSDVVVTFTDNVTDLSGSLLTSGGRAAPQVYVLAYPVDRTLWMTGSRRIKIVRADTNAVYKLAGLPSGEYLLCALTEYEPAQLNDPSFLEQLVSASIRITLGEGEKRTQDLRIGG